MTFNNNNVIVMRWPVPVPVKYRSVQYCTVQYRYITVRCFCFGIRRSVGPTDQIRSDQIRSEQIEKKNKVTQQTKAEEERKKQKRKERKKERVCVFLLDYLLLAD